MSIHNNCGLCKASVVNLSVYDGDEAIIHDVNMEFHCGEITALIGKNGSGKTTLIKALLGERPHTGNITYLDHKDGKIKKLTIGYVPQYNNNVFSMNVIDTIMMGRIAFAGHKIKSNDKDIVFELIERLNLQKFAFKNINQMSGGERQRVFIARALAQEPKVMILDEPTSSLDLKNQMFTLELITDLAKKQNLSVIMTIHDLNLVSLFADNIMILKDSEVYAYGKPIDILTEENVKNVYGVDSVVTEEDGFAHIRLKK